MAFRTRTPFPVVLPGIDRKIHTVMIQCCGDPCIHIVTGFAAGRELGLGVRRICGLVIIIIMTSKTIVRRVYIISLVTDKAVGCDSLMRSQ